MKKFIVLLSILLSIYGCGVRNKDKQVTKAKTEQASTVSSRDSSKKEGSQIHISDSTSDDTFYLRADSSRTVIEHITGKDSSFELVPYLASHSYKVEIHQKKIVLDGKDSSAIHVDKKDSTGSKHVDSTHISKKVTSDSTITANVQKLLTWKNALLGTLIVSFLILVVYLVKKFI